MAKPKLNEHPRLYELARQGARARLQDLLHEARLLMNLFPDLRDSFDRDELPLSFIVEKGSRRLTRHLRPLRKKRDRSTGRKA